MKKILTVLILIAVFAALSVFFWIEESGNQPNQLQHIGGLSNKTPNRKIQFLHFRVYHLVDGKPVESYQHGQKDIFPFMRKFDLIDNKLTVYTNARCEALVGTLGSLCCLNESSRWCNFSFGVESFYGISYGVSKFLLAKNYSLDLSFAWDGERILLFYGNKSYPLTFGNETLQLNETFARIYTDKVVKVKPYVEVHYLEVELDVQDLPLSR